jgi:hypothetical protein
MATTNRLSPSQRAPLVNGHAVKHVNGHATPASITKESPATAHARKADVANGQAGKTDRARAAADDAHVVSTGASAKAAIPPAASPDRDAYAVVARASSGETPEHDVSSETPSPRTKRAASMSSQSKGPEQPPVPPSLGPLPADAVAFTESLNAQADFLEVGKRLLNSSDERIVKGVWEHMLELRYGKEAPADENARRIVIDVERPNYDNLPTQ